MPICLVTNGVAAIQHARFDRCPISPYLSGLFISEELGAEQYGIAFRSGDQELCSTIEDAVQQLVDNGTYAKIAAKYPDIVNNLTYLNK